MYKNVILSSGGFKTEGYLEDLLEIIPQIKKGTLVDIKN